MGCVFNLYVVVVLISFGAGVYFSGFEGLWLSVFYYLMLSRLFLLLEVYIV